MYKILKAEQLTANIFLMDVEAPRVARHCEPGQFVIVKMDEKGERIPLTICDYDREAGTITIVFQPVGCDIDLLPVIQIELLAVSGVCKEEDGEKGGQDHLGHEAPDSGPSSSE